jgi:hypothetical protein
MRQKGGTPYDVQCGRCSTDLEAPAFIKAGPGTTSVLDRHDESPGIRLADAGATAPDSIMRVSSARGGIPLRGMPPLHDWVLLSIFRVVVSVNSSDSRGMLVTKGLIIQPKPNGIPRVSDTDSHCT